MEAGAVVKYIRLSPRKVRQVTDLIRGKSVDEAINILHFTTNSSSVPVEKLLRSAMANAMNKDDATKLDPEDFFIKKIWVDDGPTMRRYRPGPKGGASLIRKRSCHISIVVSDEMIKG